MTIDNFKTKILITTSISATEESRRFVNLLKNIIPNANSVNRGNSSLDSLKFRMVENKIEYLYIVTSKDGKIDKLKIYHLENNELIKQGKDLKVNQFIDHKIFGFESIPEKGPISTSIENRRLFPYLMEYFETFWGVEIDKKNLLWLAIDGAEHRNTSYISIIDALSQKKICYLEVQLL